MKSRLAEINEQINLTISRVLELEKELAVLKSTLESLLKKKEKKMEDDYRAVLRYYSEKTTQIHDEKERLHALFLEKTELCKGKELAFFARYGEAL